MSMNPFDVVTPRAGTVLGPAVVRTHSRYGHRPSSYATPLGPDARFVMRSLMGTSVRSNWIPSEAIEVALRMFPAPIAADRGVVLIVPAEPSHHFALHEAAERAFEHVVHIESPPFSAVTARTIRDLSGLGAERIGALFPVARETFQRWLTGVLVPGTDNLRRLLSLERFTRDLAARTSDVKAWMLTPIRGRVDNQTPYDLIREGRLEQAWGLAMTAGPPRFELYRDADGNFATRVSGNIVGSLETAEYEYDDFEE